MPLSVRTKEKETNSQLNLISVQETRFSHLPRTNERAKNRSFKSLCVCVVLSEWHYCSFRIRRGSLTNRLDVVLKNKKKKIWHFGLRCSFLGFLIIFPSCHVRLPWPPEPCPLADAISSVSYSFIHVLKVLFPLTCCCLSEKLHFSSIAEKMGFFRALTTQPQQRRRFDKSHAGCPGPLHVARMCVSLDQQRPERWKMTARCRAAFQESTVGGTWKGPPQKRKELKRKEEKEITGGASSNRRFVLITSRKRRWEEIQSLQLLVTGRTLSSPFSPSPFSLYAWGVVNCSVL
jgi:hypothetical protein